MNTLQNGPFRSGTLHDYAWNYWGLFKDVRLYKGFEACLTGILGSHSGCLQRIAGSIPGAGTHMERRLRRLIHDENKRSTLSPEALGKTLTEQGAAFLHGADEVKVIVDGSDLRKPHSQKLQYLDRVRDLKGHVVNGYHTLEAIGRPQGCLRRW